MIIFSVWIFTTIYVALIVTFYRAWKNIKSGRSYLPDQLVKVSVIIPVRNEENNIIDLLNDINAQHYAQDQIQVIIVDDYSTDNTLKVIEKKREEYGFDLKVISLEVDPHFKGSHKKMALTTGVELSGSELIITTDGDCRVSKGWIGSFVNIYLQEHASFISGPVVFNDEDSLFKKLQTLEFASLIGVGAASIELGYPTMCNGANLAFTKDIFNKVGGYAGFDHVHSGDDEFLLHKIHKVDPRGIFFIKEVSAIVQTDAKETLKEFSSQRRRWAGKWKHYKSFSIKGLALIIFIFNFLILVALLMLIAGIYPLKIFIIQYSLKIGIDFLFIGSIMGFMRKRLNIVHFLIIQLIYPVYAVFFGIYSSFGKYRWKDRTLKIVNNDR